MDEERQKKSSHVEPRDVPEGFGKSAQKSDWTYMPGYPPVEVRAVLVYGFDCRVACTHTPKGDHGQHNDEIRLFMRTFPEGHDVGAASAGVSGGKLVRFEEALELRLFTRYRGNTKDYQRSQRPLAAYGAWVLGHIGYVHDENDVQWDRPSQKCDILRAGGCYATEPMSVSVAREIWKDVDDEALDPIFLADNVLDLVVQLTSGVWERMRAHLCRLSDATRQARIHLPERCDACEGTGLVRRVGRS